MEGHRQAIYFAWPHLASTSALPPATCHFLPTQNEGCSPASLLASTFETSPKKQWELSLAIDHSVIPPLATLQTLPATEVWNVSWSHHVQGPIDT